MLELLCNHIYSYLVFAFGKIVFLPFLERPDFHHIFFPNLLN